MRGGGTPEVRSRAAAAAALCLCASAAWAQSTPAAAPIEVGTAPDRVLVTTTPSDGFSYDGLLRVRDSETVPEVLTPLGVGLFQVPVVWTVMPGDGSFVGRRNASVWRCGPTGPDRVIATLDVPYDTDVQPVGRARGFVLFSSSATGAGTELWITDGTPEGTERLRNLAPGTASSYPRDGVTVGSEVFFSAETPAHGRELWRTDGTADGTVLVTDLRPGPASSSPLPIGRLDGALVFSALDEGGEMRLFVTDGSVDGTRRLSDDAGRVDANSPVSRVGDVLVFHARTAETGMARIWRTDGTAAGTFGLLPEAGAWLSCAADERVWFFAEGDGDVRGLWTTDGTREGTRRAWQQTQDDAVLRGVPFRDEFVFQTNSPALGSALWFSDGTPEGTAPFLTSASVVRPFLPSPLPNTYYFGMLTATESAVWFAGVSEGRTDLWATDGTVEGTRRLPLDGYQEATQFPDPGPLVPFVDTGPEGAEPAAATYVEPEPPAPPEPLALDRLRVKVRPRGDVDVTLRCRVALAGDEALDGEVLAVDVGDVPVEVVLDARGRGRTVDGALVKARVRPRAEELRIDVRLRRADISAALEDEGLTDRPLLPVQRQVDVVVSWRGREHAATGDLLLRTRRGAVLSTLQD